MRREIWSLRDEYDRLDKLLRGHNSKKSSTHYQQEINDEIDDDDDDDCDSFSENSDSCEICKEEENRFDLNDQMEIAENVENVQKVNSGKFKNNKKLHVNFDHLSIVSEENYIELDEEPISPLRELQSVQPPLAHFENLPYELIGPSIGKFFIFVYYN